MTKVGEGWRQRSDNVRESSRLGKGDTLGCRKCDLHQTSRRGESATAGFVKLRDSATLRTESMAKHLSLTADVKEGQRG